MAEKFDKKELLNWIETQPELNFIREQANASMVSYDRSEKDINRRIRVYPKRNLITKKNFLQKLWELIWVPGRELRGTSYSDKNLDKKLTQTSALMSFSTIWDMVCTFPVLFYLFKGLASLTLPVASAASLLLLAISNAAGKFAMDRTKGNKSYATFLLIVFFLLSFVKTAFSGVGLELISSSQRLKNLKARNILEQKGLIRSEIPDKKIYEELYNNTNAECNRLIAQQSKLDITNSSQRRQFNKLEKQMNAKPRNPINNDTSTLLNNYVNELGPCTTRNLISNLAGISDNNLASSFNNIRKLEDVLTPVALLYVRSRGSYYSNFEGDALKGEPVQMSWFNINPLTGISVDPDCKVGDEKCVGPVRWVSGGDAIRVSTIDFYSKVQKGDFKSLGSSLIGFIISIILSITAVVLLYGTSTDMKVRASRATFLDKKRNEIFTKMRSKDS